MNIDISDETIEKIVEKSVQEKVDNYFNRINLRIIVDRIVEKAISKELNKFDYISVIGEEAKKLTNKEVLDGVCRRISADIADAFAEKYNY